MSMEILETPNSVSIPCQPDTLDFHRLLRLLTGHKKMSAFFSCYDVFFWTICRKDLLSGVALPGCWVKDRMVLNREHMATEICGSCFFLGVFHDTCLGTSTKADFICQICILYPSIDTKSGVRPWSFHNGHCRKWNYIFNLPRIPPCNLSPYFWKAVGFETCQDSFWHCEVSVTCFHILVKLSLILLISVYNRSTLPYWGQWCSWAQEVCLRSQHVNATRPRPSILCQHDKW